MSTGFTVRPPGMYVRLDEEWFLSTQTWTGTVAYERVRLYAPNGDDKFFVLPSRIDEVLRVCPDVEYGGWWIALGSLWDDDGERLRRAVSTATTRGLARGRYHGPDEAAVGRLPGAVVTDGRGAMGGVELTIPLHDITGYRENIDAAAVVTP